VSTLELKPVRSFNTFKLRTTLGKPCRTAASYKSPSHQLTERGLVCVRAALSPDIGVYVAADSSPNDALPA